VLHRPSDTESGAYSVLARTARRLSA